MFFSGDLLFWIIMDVEPLLFVFKKQTKKYDYFSLFGMEVAFYLVDSNCKVSTAI